VTKAVTDYVDRAKDIAKLAAAAQSSVAEASKLLATGEQFGATGDKIADALRNVSQAAAKNPDDFKKIGVATEDVNGKSRRAIDIFGDVRRVLSEGGNDYRTLAAAQALLGRGSEELWRYLTASEERIQSTTEAAAAMGMVMSEDDVKATLAFAGSMKVAEAQGNSLTRMLAQNLIPKLGDLTEAAMTAGDVLGALVTVNPGSSIKDVPILGGLDNLISGIGDALGGKPTDRLRAINDQVNAKAKVRADFAKLAAANLLSEGGSGPSLPALGGGGRDPVADALHDRIDAIKATAKAQEQATRDALQGYERERQKVIEVTTAEKDAARQGADQEIQWIQDVADAEDRAHRMRDRARTDESAALRAQLDQMSALEAVETRRADLAAAQKGLAHEKGVQIFRERGETEEQYLRRAHEQQQKVKDGEKAVADIQKAIARDATRAVIEERIKAIEAESKADARAMEDKKMASDDQIKAIRRLSDEEQLAFQARIDHAQAELKAEQQRVGDLIEGESRKTDAIVANLELQLKEHVRAAGVVGAAWDWATRPRNIAISYTSSGTSGGDAGGPALTAFAAGGEGVITQPTLLVNARTGVPFASVAENGPEPFSFGRRGGGSVSSTVYVIGLSQDEAVRAVARRVDRNLETRVRAKASSGR
jgi:hypothetical protein